MNKKLQAIIEHWSLHEGVLFKTVCTHRVERNPKLSIPFRCGHGTIEYNENIIEAMPTDEVELYFKAEAIRILLKHPYKRQPSMCSNTSISTGSNLLLSDNYPVMCNLGMPTPNDLGLETGQSFEWYAMKVESLCSQEPSEDAESESVDECEDETDGIDGKGGDNDVDNGESQGDGDGDGDGVGQGQCEGEGQEQGGGTGKGGELSEGLSQLAELWEEDCLREGMIDEIVSEVCAGNYSWGTMPSSLIEQIKAKAPKVDYRSILMSLCPSTSRTLTRMKPNRRLGFDAMGSRKGDKFNLIIGVDVSGSVGSDSLQHFLGIINNLFRHSVKNIDVVTFDTRLSDPIKFKNARSEIKISGRGGTDFCPIVAYAEEKYKKYDGLIIFTDGFAPAPPKPKHVKIVWVIDCLNSFRAVRDELGKTGKICYIPSQ